VLCLLTNLDLSGGGRNPGDGRSLWIPPHFSLADISQIRRQARERRQYIYAKSLEAQERQTYQRKQQLKDALATGKRLPTELKKDAKKLGNDLAFDDAQAGMEK